MKKLVLITIMAIIAMTATAQSSQVLPTYSKPMVDTRGQQAVLGEYTYFYAEEPANIKSYASGSGKYKDKKWDYVPGLVCKALLKYYNQYKDNDIYKESAKNAFSIAKDYADGDADGGAIKDNGEFKIVASNNKYDSNFFVPGSIDAIATSKILIDLYKALPESDADRTKYYNAATWIYNYLTTGVSVLQKDGTTTKIEKYPRIGSDAPLDGTGGFYHKSEYVEQMWLDGLYMGAAYYAEYLHTFAPDNEDGWNDVALQFITIHNKTWDGTKKLNYHGWSANPTNSASINWADPNTGCSKEFWGRGMGWYFAALVDVLEYMPESNSNYTTLLNILNAVADGLAARQQDNGVWCQLLQYPYEKTFTGNIWTSSKDMQTSESTLKNYYESSASCMFTYAYLKACRLGLLDNDVYGEIADKAFNGIQNVFISKEGKSIGSICRSAGLGTGINRDGSAFYYLGGYDTREIATNEGKGVGPYIMACLEYELKHPTVYKDVEYVVVSPANITLEVGDTKQLEVQVLPTDASNKDVTWSVEGSGVTVSDGFVTAVDITDAPCKVYATSNNGIKDCCFVTVVAKQETSSGNEEIIYSWESPEGTVSQSGGTVVEYNGANINDSNPNAKNIPNNTTYYTIKLSGAINFSSQYMTVTLSNGNTFKEGDIIYLTAYRNKEATDKQATALLQFEKDGKTTSLEIGLNNENNGYGFVNLNSKGDTPEATSPNTLQATIPTDADGCTSFKMTRGKTATNLYITKIKIAREGTGGSSNSQPEIITKYISEHGWASFVPEKNVEVPAETNGVKVYYVKEGSYDNYTVKAVQIKSGEVIAKKQGYIIKGENKNHEFTVNESEATYTFDGNENMLKCGKNEPIEKSCLVFGQVNNTPGFYALTSYDINVPEGIVYIDTIDISGASGAKSIVLDFDDSTGIQQIETDTKETSNKIFTISGQRINNISHHGVYIVDGKKIAVK